ncbi:MAG TPA: ferritin [candidate division Zixibacteria bacterium]|nr:ferritin [candidate division Zixibacteria bacterium]
MMISQKMADAINEQIKNEFYSGWLYTAMAYKFESMGLKVFAKWYYKQAGEEREHAEKFAKYLIDQGAEVMLTAIDKPKTNWKSAEEMTTAAVEHEKVVTTMIHKLVDLARSENDHATFNMLQWFVDEQVEEVASATELMDMVKLATAPGQLLMLEGRLYHMVEAK